MIIVAVIVALVVGAAVGWMGRSMRPVAQRESRDSTGEQRRQQHTGEVTGALRQTVDQIGSAVIIYDDQGAEIYRNRTASALVGTHVGVIVDGHLDEILDEILAGMATREPEANGPEANGPEANGPEAGGPETGGPETGGTVERSVEVHGPPRQDLAIRGARLSGGAVVAIIDDVSERMQIDAMRTDFVANISHELKTPVGAIAVLAEALDGERDTAVIERMSQRLVDEAHRAVGTIDDLLELSRIEVGGIGSDVVVLDDVIATAIERGRAVDEHLAVGATGSDEPICLRADRRQLVSAIGNLVENAVKYSGGEGGVQVRTRVSQQGIEVMVTDQGVGIPDRDLHRVFERFYRVDRSRQRETGGTGLGLAIVRHVATNHGGDVVVSSEEGEGSTFVLRLPTSLLVTDPPGADLTSDEASPSTKEDA